MPTESLGIVPPGALGVSFFYHLTRQLTDVDRSVFFVARQDSASARELREKGELRVMDDRGLHSVPLAGLMSPDLLACAAAGHLPDILLVCTNPDQLTSIVTTYVELLEKVNNDGQLGANPPPIPLLVLCANGIYFQRLRQIFIEKIEEATLLGRLPDLWPDIMPRIVGRLLRGVTLQTGVREGSGSAAVYRPGPRAITRLAGGELAMREFAGRILSAKGAWVELAAHASATRLEFDKAIVNLTGNLLGQLYAIDEEGRFRLLQVRDIVTSEHEPEIRELTHQVFRVGQAVKAYAKDEKIEPVYENVMNSSRQHHAHIPSSLQWVGLRLRLGELRPEISPTEAWLLDPLIRYAHSAQLIDAAAYFENLKARLLAKLALAAGKASGQTQLTR